MQIRDSVALVTGARRGLGAEWINQLQQRGARKIYAAVRDRSDEPIPGATIVRLDVSDAAAVNAAAARASDVTLLINNAGIDTHQALVTGEMTEIRREMETNYFGTLHLVRAFAPVLASNGGGAILNVLSALAWYSYEGEGGYGAAKAAAWSLTDSARVELAAQRTQVSGLYVGAVDTDMSANYDGPKVSPAQVVNAGLHGIEAGHLEILIDDTAQQAKASLNLDPAQRYPQLTQGS